MSTDQHQYSRVLCVICVRVRVRVALRCVELRWWFVHVRTLGAHLIGALEHAVVPVRAGQGETTLRG